MVFPFSGERGANSQLCGLCDGLIAAVDWDTTRSRQPGRYVGRLLGILGWHCVERMGHQVCFVTMVEIVVSSA